MNEYLEVKQELDRQHSLEEAIEERAREREALADELRAERIALIERMAFEGNQVAIRWAAELATARGPDAEDRVLRQVAREWEEMKRVLRATHERISRVVGEHTGMTLEDFVWLRDYEDE